MARTKGLHFLLLLNITSCLQNLLNIRKTVTAVVTDFLEASIPAAEAMLTAFQELEKGVDQNRDIKNLLATGLEGAAKNLRD